jgi:TRAP-type C4-dicarboxylate transport system substrate-binding protein
MTTASLTTAVPELALFDMYCAIPSTEVFVGMLKEPAFMEKFQGWFEKAGLHLILVCPSNNKYMATTKKINSIDDFKGFTMRTLANNYHITFWKAVGANTAQITAPELYLAIKQGLVQGLEMDLHGFISFNVHEVAKYFVDARLLRHTTVGVMNLDAWNSISAEDKAWFNEFLDGAKQYYAKLGLEDDEHSWEAAKAASIERVGFDQKLFDDLKAVAEKSVWKLVREKLGDKIVDDFLADISKIQNK